MHCIMSWILSCVNLTLMITFEIVIGFPKGNWFTKKVNIPSTSAKTHTEIRFLRKCLNTFSDNGYNFYSKIFYRKKLFIFKSVLGSIKLKQNGIFAHKQNNTNQMEGKKEDYYVIKFLKIEILNEI